MMLQKRFLNQQILLLLVLIAFITTVLSGNLNPDGADNSWWSGFLQNFSTEMMGAIITFALFELVLGGQQRADAEKSQMESDLARLKGLLASEDAVMRKMAFAELQSRGWLKDGSLRGMNLEYVQLIGANLTKAQLGYANLTGSTLNDANLTGAWLKDANLTGSTLNDANLTKALLIGVNLTGTTLNNANLMGARLEYARLMNAQMNNANLTGARLEYAGLTDANLETANLSAADLRSSNLSGASLKDATLQHMNLFNARYNQKTRLPDGTLWTIETDMTRFGTVMIKDEDEWFAYLHQHDLLRQHLSRYNDAAYKRIVQQLHNKGLIE
ncbi:MAG: pentapeptide repeat-containing protein [Aggregatilineales bacterium]